MSGPFGSSQWMYASGGFYNGVATQSLRFDRGSTAYLSRTPSASNRRTWTWSGWVKRGNLGNFHSLFSATTELASGNSHSYIAFNNDGLIINNYTYPSGTNWNLQTNALFRDVSAWYHIVLVVDTTQATSTDRLKLYVNGEQVTSFSSSTYPSQNYEGFINSTYKHKIGNAYIASSTYGLDGYKAEVNFVDGTQLDPTSFGEFKNGVWIPIEYTGSYGTNGFRLQFNQTGTGTASSSTIGADTSGNANHFSSSGIVASDCSLFDSPENNFATLNSTIRPYTVTPAETVSDGNLNAFFNSSAVSGSYWSTFLLTSGKWYFEVLIDAVGSNANVGISNNPDASGRGTYTAPANGYGYFYKMTGEKGINNTFTSYGATYTTNDIIGCAFDLDNDTITFYKNNVSQGQITGVAPYDANNRGFIPALTGFNGVRSVINFGQDSSFAGNETAQGNTDANGIGDFYYSPPSGYIALCTSNLPEPTISPNAGDGKQSDDYFNTATYFGNSSTQDITSVGFQPDWVWIKSRSNASNHYLTDVVRGTSKGLQTNISNAEVTNTDVITSFNSDGFSLGNDATANVANITGRTYVSWNWKAGGTAVSNTDGSITSSVSANTDAGFSIVAYQGNDASSATVGHGLSQAPEVVIVKNRQEAITNPAWAIYHSSLGATKYIDLSTTSAEGTATSVWNDTAPTSTVVTIGTADSVNSGSNHIMYCFHSVEGFSKIGSYNSNSSADGPMIYLGFRPKWVLIKKIDGAASWWLVDAVRDTYNPTDSYILPDTSDTDRTYTTADFLSNGFKIRNTSTAFNSGTHIYMAFAENPFKYANAR